MHTTSNRDFILLDCYCKGCKVNLCSDILALTLLGFMLLLSCVCVCVCVCVCACSD